MCRVLTDQAVHEHELVRGPGNRLDSLLGDAALVVQQGHVRPVVRLQSVPEPGRLEHLAKSLLKRRQCSNAITSDQHERPVARSAQETQRAVEPELERRHHDRRRRLACQRDDVPRQTLMVAEVMQRDMEALGRERFALQPMFVAPLLREPGDGARQRRRRTGARRTARPSAAARPRAPSTKAARACGRRAHGRYDSLPFRTACTRVSNTLPGHQHINRSAAGRARTRRRTERHHRAPCVARRSAPLSAPGAAQVQA